MAWAFAITGRGSQGLSSAVAAAVRAPSEPLAPRSLAGTAWALAKGGYREPGLYREIGRLSCNCIGEFGPHDVAALCWGLSTAEAADRSLYEGLAQHLVQGNMVRRLGPPLAAELAWGFAAGGSCPAPLFEELEHVCVSRIEELETEDVVGFAWSFAVAGRTEPVVWRAILRYAERFAGRLRESERRVLSWALAAVRAGPLPQTRKAEPPTRPAAAIVPPAGIARAPP